MPKKEEYEIVLREFNMNFIGDNKVILFIGKRGTGKSTLVLDYLMHHQDIPLGTVISPTDRFNETYRPHMPVLFIHDKFEPELISKILKRQAKIVEKCRREPNCGIDPRFFIILDDCLASAKEWKNDENIRTIFMNGRHLQITFIITMQYVLGIPPDLRTNIDWIFICKEPKIENKVKLHKYYAGMFPTYPMFNEVLRKCTSDFGCLVIDNSSTSENISDQVFWYRADHDSILNNNFKLFDKNLWKNNEKYLSNSRFDSDYQHDINRIGQNNRYNINTTLVKADENC